MSSKEIRGLLYWLQLQEPHTLTTRNNSLLNARARRCSSLLAAVICMLGFASGSAQTAAAPVHLAEADAIRPKVTGLRDAFIARIHSAGYTCRLAPPKIVVEDVPSFGNYEESDNTLHTSAWELLNPQERGFFIQLAGPNGGEAGAAQLFEIAAHEWIFVHEMGHWWQACNGVNTINHTPYKIEYDANRIALSYWREADASLVGKVMPVFQGVYDHSPSPLSGDQSAEVYFNKNYATLGPSPAYPWFMSRMNLDAYAEKPAPSFALALASMAK